MSNTYNDKLAEYFGKRKATFQGGGLNGLFQLYNKDVNQYGRVTNPGATIDRKMGGPADPFPPFLPQIAAYFAKKKHPNLNPNEGILGMFEAPNYVEELSKLSGDPIETVINKIKKGNTKEYFNILKELDKENFFNKENEYEALNELFKRHGNPKLTNDRDKKLFGMFKGTGTFDPFTNTVNAPDLFTAITELAHKVQDNKGGAVWPVIKGWWKDPFFTRSGWGNTYSNPNTFEGEAHGPITDDLIDQYANLLDSIGNAKYNNKLAELKKTHDETLRRFKDTKEDNDKYGPIPAIKSLFNGEYERGGPVDPPEKNIWSKFLKGVSSLAPGVSGVGNMLANYGSLNPLNPGMDILGPMSIPGNMVQAAYTPGVSVGDAMKGQDVEKGFIEEVLTDPLTYFGSATLPKKLTSLLSVHPKDKAFIEFFQSKDGVEYIKKWYADPEIAKRINVYNPLKLHPESGKYHFNDPNVNEIKIGDYANDLKRDLPEDYSQLNKTSDGVSLVDKVYIRNGLKEPYKQSVIVHELNHAVNMNRNYNKFESDELLKPFGPAPEFKQRGFFMNTFFPKRPDVQRSYFVSPTEIHARMASARHALGKKPGDIFTDKEYNLLKKYNDFDDMGKYIKDKDSFIKLMNSYYKQGGAVNETGYTPGTPTMNNPFNIIPGGNITMKDTPFNVLGILAEYYSQNGLIDHQQEGGPILSPLVGLMSLLRGKGKTSDPITQNFVVPSNNNASIPTKWVDGNWSPQTFGQLGQEEMRRAWAQKTELEESNENYSLQEPGVKLTEGHLRGAKIPNSLIQDVKKAGDKYGVDPLDILAVAGKESTFGYGPFGSTRVQDGQIRSRDLFTFNDFTVKPPKTFEEFAFDKGKKVEHEKGFHGYRFTVPDSEVENIYNDHDLKKEYIKYLSKFKDDPEQVSIVDLIAKRIAERGVGSINPGDTAYPQRVQQYKQLLMNNRTPIKFQQGGYAGDPLNFVFPSRGLVPDYAQDGLSGYFEDPLMLPHAKGGGFFGGIWKGIKGVGKAIGKGFGAFADHGLSFLGMPDVIKNSGYDQFAPDWLKKVNSAMGSVASGVLGATIPGAGLALSGIQGIVNSTVGRPSSGVGGQGGGFDISGLPGGNLPFGNTGGGNFNTGSMLSGLMPQGMGQQSFGGNNQQQQSANVNPLTMGMFNMGDTLRGMGRSTVNGGFGNSPAQTVNPLTEGMFNMGNMLQSMGMSTQNGQPMPGGQQQYGTELGQLFANLQGRGGFGGINPWGTPGFAGIQPRYYQEGGEVGEQQPAMIPIQTEKGEVFIHLDGSITPVNAKTTHKRMDEDEVTDVVPEGTYVTSNDKKIRMTAKEAEEIVMGVKALPYEEFKKGVLPEETLFSEIFGGSKKLTPAEMTQKILRKFPTMDRSTTWNKNDIFTEITNKENMNNRLPWLEQVILFNESRRGKQPAREFKQGGPVKMDGVRHLPKGGSVRKFGPGGDILSVLGTAAPFLIDLFSGKNKNSSIDPIARNMILGSSPLYAAGVNQNINAQNQQLETSIQDFTGLGQNLNAFAGAQAGANIAGRALQQTDFQRFDPRLQDARLANFQTRTPNAVIDALSTPRYDLNALAGTLGPRAFSNFASQLVNSENETRNNAILNQFNADRGMGLNILGQRNALDTFGQQFNIGQAEKQQAARNAQTAGIFGDVSSYFGRLGDIQSQILPITTQLALQKAGLAGQKEMNIAQNLMNTGSVYAQLGNQGQRQDQGQGGGQGTGNYEFLKNLIFGSNMNTGNPIGNNFSNIGNMIGQIFGGGAQSQNPLQQYYDPFGRPIIQ